MKIGVAFSDAELSWAQHTEVAREAARLGYGSSWAASGLRQDAFIKCVQWWNASSDILPGGMLTGTNVVPVPIWSPLSLATMAGTVSELTGGRFVLGIGAGGTRNAAYRRTVGLPRVSPLELVRDYLVAVRGLLSGATVTHVGCTFAIDGAKLHFKPPFVPLYVAALGPQMLRLAGVAADGVMLSWTSPTQNAWTRARVAEGANQAGRDPSTVSFVGYVRMCIDEDVALARDAVSRQFQMYEGLGSGYDQHFQRMFGKEAMAKLVAARNAGLSEEERAKTIPDEMLRQVAYFGPAAGAPAAFRRLSVGMDVALVRVIIARPEGDHASQVVNSLRACSPLLAGASLPPD